MSTSTNRIERYYDSHTRDDEELTQTIFHQTAIEQLMLRLRWLLTGQLVGFTTNVNFYMTDDPMEEGISPDVALVDGLHDYDRTPDEPGSYYVGEDGPPPRVVFEISSQDTWRQDLGVDNKLPPAKQKPARYAAMGVAEYFVFDPNQRKLWTRSWKAENRLVGWWLNVAGEYERIEKTVEGWLWSEQLQSFLVVEGNYLVLYTQDGERRLTETEALQQQSEANWMRAEEEERRAMAAQQRADQEQQRAVEAQQRADQEQQRAVEAQQRADQEQRRADQEQQRAERLARRLRELGENPDEL